MKRVHLRLGQRRRRFGLHFLAALLLIAPLLSVVSAGPATASACPCGMLGSGTPGIVDVGPDTPNKFGMAFSADTYGWVTGVRFYKASGNTGTHVGQIFAQNDINYSFELARVTFTGESASGWQTATFAKPVYVMPGNTYVVSYTSPNGHWSYTSNYFASAVDNSPLHVAASGGRYHNTGAIPEDEAPSFTTASAFGVDVIFETTRGSETSLFGGTTATPTGAPDIAGQVGTRFSSDVNTRVIGVRFWGESNWFHPYWTYLYTSNGTLLASQTTGSQYGTYGWVEYYFITPIDITANTEYVAAMSQDVPGTNTGFKPTYGYFASPYTNGNFHAPANAGVYSPFGDSSVFPTTQTTTNFWVEPVFANEASVAVTTTIDPSFTFSVTNRATACNGESNFVTGAGSASAIALGHVAGGANVSGGQALTVAGNSGGGFNVYVRGPNASQNLRSTGHNWTDVAGTYASPAVLGSGERFGYTYKDSTTSSSVTNPSSANFIALDGTNRAVMGSASSSSGSGCISFDAQTSTSTPAAAYSAAITYTAIPSF